MFLYILFIFSSEPCQDTCFETFHKQIVPVENNFETNSFNQYTNLNTTTDLNEQEFFYQSQYITSVEPLILEPKCNYLHEIQNFVLYMKSNHLQLENSNIQENTNESYLKSVTFNNAFEIWQNEYYETSINTNKHLSKQNLKKYKKYSDAIRIFENNFKKIHDPFLPTIKKEVESSSINTMSKSLILENLEIISRTMEYFARLKPRYLKYTYNTETMILYHTLALERFPYLFDYFALCKRFLNLYEMIIEVYNFIPNQYMLHRTLYDMSKNLTYKYFEPLNQQIVLYDNNVENNGFNHYDTSNTSTDLNEESSYSQRENPTASDNLVLQSERNHVIRIVRFVKYMKKKHLYIKTSKIHTNILECYHKSVTFNNAFAIWQNEHYETFPIKVKKFSDQDLKKYNKYYKTIRIFENNFRRINDLFLPTIKNEVESSSINTKSKSLFIENLDKISSTMSYFVKLKPKNLKYNINIDTLILYHKLVLERFPYLFDYFELCKRFVNMYELIIEKNEILANECMMIRTLYDMSKNLTYIFKKKYAFLSATQNILTLLRDHKSAN
ncbi:uncharacterized protein VNE69_08169 [Vairimorpha necatrix]|uniref:KIF-binding protein n=1 Tax=Vairimorpha necatrix TaxID=6039 RepID=A0AAX4JEG0_9MICR